MKQPPELHKVGSQLSSTGDYPGPELGASSPVLYKPIICNCLRLDCGGLVLVLDMLY